MSSVVNELYFLEIKKAISVRYKYLKDNGCMNIQVKNEQSEFYNEEIIKVMGTPTHKTWNLYNLKKQELKDNGYYIIKQKDKWTFFGVIIPSRIYLEVAELQRIKEVQITENVSDNIKGYLKDHQKEVIDYNFNVFRDKRLFIDTSDAGTGKTYVSLALIKQLQLVPILVIPAVSIAGWIRALRHYGITRYYITTYELFKRGKFTTFKRNKRGKVMRVNLDLDFIYLDDYGGNKFDFAPTHCIVYDEAHRLKNMNTKNFKFFSEMMESKPPYLMFLSATISESPAKAVPIFYAMGMKETENIFNTFMKGIGCVRKGSQWTFEGDRDNLIKVHTLFTQYGKRMKLQSIDGLPSNTIIPELYTIDEAPLIENLYKFMEAVRELQKRKDIEKLKEYVAKIQSIKLSNSGILVINQKIEELQDKLMDAEMENHFLAIRTRLLQIIELNKLPLIIELANNAIDDGYSVAIFLNYTDSIKILADQIGIDCIFTGKNKQMGYKDREECRLDFQNGKSNVIIGTFSAMRESVDLHDIIGGKPRMVFMPFSDSAQSFIQALGRVHRTGKMTPSIQYIICIEGTVEEQVKDNLENKLFNLTLINDGDLDPLGVYKQIYKDNEIKENHITEFEVEKVEVLYNG